MARAIKSILANRKLFQGGGLVPPGNPMQNLNQANGILASSQPLIDSVVSDAVNPQGGGTLSMNQGGIARFQDGGVNDDLISRTASKYKPPTEFEKILHQLTLGENPSGLESAVSTSRGVPVSGTVAETLEIEKLPPLLSTTAEGPDLNRPLNPYQDSREYQLRHLYGATNEQINEILATIPELTAQEIINGEFSWSEQLPGGEEDPLRRRTDEEYQISISTPYELEAIEETPVEETPVEERKDVELSEVAKGPPPFGASPTEVAALGVPTDKGNTVTVANSIDTGESDEVESSTIYDALRSQGPNADEDVINSGLNDLMKRLMEISAATPGETPTPTMEQLKADIEAALPAIEEDPSMKGLHTILLGAAIAGGTSSNPWTNIANGVVQQLPNIINYKAKQTEAKRSRQATIAKLAIEQKLGLEAEARLEAREIRKEKRAVSTEVLRERRAEQLALRTPTKYIVAADTKLRADLFNPNAPKDSLMTVPKGMGLSLTDKDWEEVTRWGLKVIPLDDIGDPDAMDFWRDVPLVDSTEINKWYSPPQTVEIFREWYPGGKGYEYFMMTPTGAGIAKERSLNLIIGAEIDGLQGAFELVSGRLSETYDRLQSLKEHDPAKMVGFGGVRGRIGDMVSAISPADSLIPGMDAFKEVLLRGEDASTVSKFEAEARIVLAEIVPMVLGESGRTISDADRVLVAQALGFEVQVDDLGVKHIVGFDKNFWKNPARITYAINTTSKIIEKNFMAMQREYETHLRRLSIGSPSEAEVQAVPTSPFKVTVSKKGEITSGALPRWTYDAETGQFAGVEPS